MRRGADGAPSRAMCLRSLVLAALVLMLTAGSTIAPALAGGVEVEPVDAEALIADCQSAPDPIACLQDQATSMKKNTSSMPSSFTSANIVHAGMSILEGLSVRVILQKIIS